MIRVVVSSQDIFPTATLGWLCQFTVLGAWLGINLSQDAPLRPNPRVTEVHED